MPEKKKDTKNPLSKQNKQTNQPQGDGIDEKIQ